MVLTFAFRFFLSVLGGFVVLLVDTFQAGFTNQVVEGRVLKLALERFQVPLQVCHCLSGFRVIGRISTLSAAGVHAAECNIVLIASALTFCPVAPKSLMDLTLTV